MSPNSDKLVSVIIPVYNVEKYIDECVSSVVNQTYENLEIILVDDGSTDTSGSICDIWQKKDNRVRVVHRLNGGLSAARNSGLDIAKGDYISFIDSDDYVNSAFIDELVKSLEETDSEFAFCDIDSERLGDADRSVTKPIVMSAKDCRDWLLNPISREYVQMVIACNKLFKKECFDTFRFKVGRIHEDEFMINNFLYYIQKAVFVPYKNYIYRVNNQGITGSDKINDIKHLDAIDAYEDRIRVALDHEDKAFSANTLKWALLKLSEFYKNGDNTMKLKVKEKYSYLFGHYRRVLSCKQNVKYLLFKVSPELFCELFR